MLIIAFVADISRSWHNYWVSGIPTCDFIFALLWCAYFVWSFDIIEPINDNLQQMVFLVTKYFLFHINNFLYLLACIAQ